MTSRTIKSKYGVNNIAVTPTMENSRYTRAMTAATNFSNTSF